MFYSRKEKCKSQKFSKIGKPVPIQPIGQAFTLSFPTHSYISSLSFVGCKPYEGKTFLTWVHCKIDHDSKTKTCCRDWATNIYWMVLSFNEKSRWATRPKCDAPEIILPTQNHLPYFFYVILNSEQVISQILLTRKETQLISCLWECELVFFFFFASYFCFNLYLNCMVCVISKSH